MKKPKKQMSEAGSFTQTFNTVESNHREVTVICPSHCISMKSSFKNDTLGNMKKMALKALVEIKEK